MGPLGWQETIFIFVLALLIFGPKKLPELGKTIGKAMTEFRRASSELKATWNREMESIEREGRSIQEETRKVSNEISSSYYDSGSDYGYGSEYDYGYSGSYDSGSSSAASPAANAATAASGTLEASTPEGVVPATGEPDRGPEEAKADPPTLSPDRAAS